MLCMRFLFSPLIPSFALGITLQYECRDNSLHCKTIDVFNLKRKIAEMSKEIAVMRKEHTEMRKEIAEMRKENCETKMTLSRES